MTMEQKAQIEKMRHDNQGYAAIAKFLDVSVSSVKAYCQRNGLAGNRTKPDDEERCKECGKPLHQRRGRKHAKFCSPICRQKWWNNHPEEVRRKAVYSYTCTYCGKTFTAYGNSHRKYCSHECYIAGRFGGDGHGA